MTTELAEWSWVVLPAWGRLHHARSLDNVATFENESGGLGRTSCGRRGYLMVPGLFSRMGLPRCKICCKILGWPQGIGSPKNQHDLRPLVEARLDEQARTAG